MTGKKDSRPGSRNNKITFRLLRETDLPLMHRWLNTPHVSEWWSLGGDHHPSPEKVAAYYSPRIAAKQNVDCYIINYENKPIGMIQSCDLAAEPEEMKNFRVEGKCVGLDLFIGEEEYVHRGLGSGIIRQFLKEKVFNGPSVEKAVIDPQVENEIAIKACEKAGFKYLHTIWYEPDRVYEKIMAISRDEILVKKVYNL